MRILKVLKPFMFCVGALFTLSPPHVRPHKDLKVREKQRPLPEHTPGTLTFPTSLRCMRRVATNWVANAALRRDKKKFHADQSHAIHVSKCADNNVFTVRCRTVTLQLYATTGGMLVM